MKVQYEIVDHGYTASDYSQGCGADSFDYVSTGTGHDAREAYEDACEGIAQRFPETARHLPARPHGIRKTDKVPARIFGEPTSDDIYWFVSIRYNALEEA